jgi:hypothetical protein
MAAGNLQDVPDSDDSNAKNEGEGSVWFTDVEDEDGSWESEELMSL